MQAVIYARVSRDRDGKARSVEEQVAECRQECGRRDWTVTEVIIDNDIGASQHSAKKNRPGYKELKKALKTANVLVAWEASRVTRNPWELEELIPLAAESGALLCYSGSIYDPTKPTDKLTLRITGATSAHEVDQSRERILRGVRHRVAEGKPHGRMPYGYKREFDPDTGEVTNWSPDPNTAPVISEAATRLLAGDTLYGICKDFQKREVPTPSRGGSQPKADRWVPSRLRTMLQSPTYAGLRSHKGEITGAGSWEPIIPEADWRRLQALLADPGRRTTHRGSEPVHLLSGIAECGRCGNPKMRWFGPKSLKTPRYECDQCYLGRRADKVEELVNETMIQFLEDPRMIEALTADSGDDAAEALSERLELQQRLDALRTEYIDGKVTAASFAMIEEQLTSKIAEAEDRARAQATNPLLASLAGPDARNTWHDLDLLVRRQAIASALRVVIQYQPPMGRRFDPDCVDLIWRK